MFDGQDGTTAGVTVQFGQDDSVQLQCLVKGGSAVHGVLTRHAIHNQINLMGLDLTINLFQLSHQLFVDGQSPSRIENDDLGILFLGLSHRVSANLHRVGFAFFGVHGDSDGFTNHMQLVNSCRSLKISRCQERSLALLSNQPSQLSARCRFSRSL